MRQTLFAAHIIKRRDIVKKAISVILVFALLSATLISASAVTPLSTPSCSIRSFQRAVPAGESIGGACIISSDNGFRDDLRLSADYFEISGTGKVELSDFSTTVNGNTVVAYFKITGTYPGEARIQIKPDTVYDKAGICNTTNTVPVFVDVKLFNTEGEEGYEKMSEFEYLITVIVAPFWSLLRRIGLV